MPCGRPTAPPRPGTVALYLGASGRTLSNVVVRGATVVLVTRNLPWRDGTEVRFVAVPGARASEAGPGDPRATVVAVARVEDGTATARWAVPEDLRPGDLALFVVAGAPETAGAETDLYVK